MARYGKLSQKKVERSIHKIKKGKLISGKRKVTVKDLKQAIAIGLSETRKEGGKVPDIKRKKI